MLPLHHNAKCTTETQCAKNMNLSSAHETESMLSGTGDVRRELIYSERLKDEVEQLLKLSFSMSNQLLHSV